MGFGELRAGPSIGIKPVPSWVLPVTPGGKPAAGKDFSNGYYIAFSDTQVNLDEQSVYRRVIRQIVSESGVQNGSEMVIGFDPSYERLHVHSLIVWREGVATSRLNLADFKLIPVESDRQRFIYNGYYTASVILKDIRKGDRIELEYSLVGWNPVFKGKYSEFFYFASNEYLGHVHAAVLARANRKLYTKNFNKPPARSERTVNGLRVYEWDKRNIKRIAYEENVPYWHDETPQVQITEFANWKEVVDWGLNFYSVPTISGALKRKADEWKLTSDSRLAYIEKAVRFVQDEVRYLGIETGENSHRPHPPAEVFQQRYGDCKDKTLLLCAILKYNGIDAAPVLVDTYKRSHLEDFLPSPADFNHVVTRVLMHDIQNRAPEPSDYIFIDATLSLQGGAVSQTYFPPYGSGLLLKEGEGKLLHIEAQHPGSIEVTEDYYLPAAGDTASTGLLQVKTVCFNHDAENFRSLLQESVRSELEDTYLNFYTQLYKNTSFDRLDSVEIYDQRAANNVSVVERYHIKHVWQQDAETGGWYFQVLGRVMYDQLDVLPAGKRNSPVFLKYPNNYTYKARVHFADTRSVPVDHWKVERMAYDILFKSEFLPKEKVWQLTYVFKSKQDHVPADQIGQYRKDIDKFTGLLEPRVEDTASSLLNWNSMNGWMLTLALLTVVCCYIAARKFERYSPGTRFHAPAKSKNGWLILIGIGIVAISLLLPLGLMTAEAGSFFTDAEWYRMDGTTELRILGYHSFLVMQCIFYVGLWCYSVFLWRLYFGNRDSFPIVYSAFLSFNLAFEILTIVLNHVFSIPQEANAFAKIPFQILWAAAITSYMYKSTSVKQTFVNTWEDRKGVRGREENQAVKDID